MAKSKRVTTIGIGIDSWQASDDLNTLMQARKIRSDPKRFAAAKELAKTRLTEIAQIAGATSDKDGDE